MSLFNPCSDSVRSVTKEAICFAFEHNISTRRNQNTNFLKTKQNITIILTQKQCLIKRFEIDILHRCTKDKTLYLICQDWCVWFPWERTKAEFVWNISVTSYPSPYQLTSEGNRFDISEATFILWYWLFIFSALLTDKTYF